MSAKLCAHLRPDDRTCRAVAVAGSAFCHHHRRTQQRLRRQQHTARIARRQDNPTHFGLLNTQPAIIRAISRVLRALAAGDIDSNLTTALLFRLQRAAYALTQRETTNLEPCTSNLEHRRATIIKTPAHALPNEQRTTTAH